MKNDQATARALDPTEWNQFGIVQTKDGGYMIIRCLWPGEGEVFKFAVLNRHPYPTFDEAVRVFREDILPRRATP